MRLRLTVPVSALPEPRLGHKCRIRLGRTGVLGLKGDRPSKRTHLTVSLGYYSGLDCKPLPLALDGGYRFD